MRPEKNIDWEKVDKLLMAGCLGTEICVHFDMHPDTFYRRVTEKYHMGFTDYSSLKRSQGDSVLRAKQYEKALEKDNTMMIWLGKNRLGQRENHEEKQVIPREEILLLEDEIIKLKSLLRKIQNESESKAGTELLTS